jgi:hypothetical protein
MKIVAVPKVIKYSKIGICEAALYHVTEESDTEAETESDCDSDSDSGQVMQKRRRKSGHGCKRKGSRKLPGRLYNVKGFLKIGIIKDGDNLYFKNKNCTFELSLRNEKICLKNQEIITEYSDFLDIPMFPHENRYKWNDVYVTRHNKTICQLIYLWGRGTNFFMYGDCN